jgi:hypothetical protein
LIPEEGTKANSESNNEANHTFSIWVVSQNGLSPSRKTSVFCEGDNGYLFICSNRATKETVTQHENVGKRWFGETPAYFLNTLS